MPKQKQPTTSPNPVVVEEVLDEELVEEEGELEELNEEVETLPTDEPAPEEPTDPDYIEAGVVMPQWPASGGG